MAKTEEPLALVAIDAVLVFWDNSTGNIIIRDRHSVNTMFL